MMIYQTKIIFRPLTDYDWINPCVYFTHSLYQGFFTLAKYATKCKQQIFNNKLIMNIINLETPPTHPIGNLQNGEKIDNFKQIMTRQTLTQKKKNVLKQNNKAQQHVA